jgi:hypothetical protein
MHADQYRVEPTGKGPGSLQAGVKPAVAGERDENCPVGHENAPSDGCLKSGFHSSTKRCIALDQPARTIREVLYSGCGPAKMEDLVRQSAAGGSLPFP